MTIDFSQLAAINCEFFCVSISKKSTFSAHSHSKICTIQFFFVTLHPVMNHAGACGWGYPPNTLIVGHYLNILEGVY